LLGHSLRRLPIDAWITPMIRWVARLLADARMRYGGGTLLAGLAIAIAATVRLGPILIAPFPLGDGGLFATMADDIRAAGFGLPATTSYNGGGIPFAYPPLGLYVLAAVPGDPVSTERWLPLVWSLAAVVAAWSLARELSNARTAGVATVIFAAMPITWAIEGGGVTRGLGFLLLLATLWSAAVTTRRPTVSLTATTGILASLALLAHPAVGPSLVALGTLLLARRWSGRAAIAMTGAVGIALLGIAPWLWLVLSRHGPGPLLTAATSHTQRQRSCGCSRMGRPGSARWTSPLPLHCWAGDRDPRPSVVLACLDHRPAHRPERGGPVLRTGVGHACRYRGPCHGAGAPRG